MKRLLPLIALIFAVLVCFGCRAQKYEIAMITDVGTIDDKSFNQGTWEGVKKFGQERNISHKYYKPQSKSTEDYIKTIDLAIKGGAKVVVTPGYLFEPAIYVVQDKYPDVKFILIDGAPNNFTYDESGNLISGEERIEDNVYSLFYAEEQSGFLAGYAVVKDGFRNLGFMGGMAVPAVVRFGHGFVQGAEYAARELGLDNDAISIKYHYIGKFEPTPETQTMAASWYAGGVDVIFVAAGGAGSSVMKAAEATENKYVIGVDVDQSAESDTVITSAVKMLATSVYQCLDVIYNENSEYKNIYKAGQKMTLDASIDGVGLPSDFSRFPNKRFTKQDYDAIFAKLKNREVTVSKNLKPDNVTFEEFFNLDKVQVTVIS